MAFAMAVAMAVDGVVAVATAGQARKTEPKSTILIKTNLVHKYQAAAYL